ncbi:2-C-methyl-D-erythritol 4-phosphate cytidylyltransferase [Albibacterium bauzanense]|uniref:2-C-methyl-D-erythritol 4-phosphate cytidylyltransferase n=1 Tax=Albibacterium bauzanense TaxID=653929 RepID=A0A4R1LZ00_9SPHI|nr:2-C-methyl-D-erythritol 4-phosphate cytidylyltransferase [Albibacterium bauzanense]TCK84806.1 2-C-methyl-D-erythritol 4-phosphate cytidylyltransferase [Albibacterium bauzanense]
MAVLSKYVIIVSGGTGSRMDSSLPKQFHLLNGLPILMHSLYAFYRNDKSIKIILVINKAHQKLWEDLCKKYAFEVPYDLVYGGESRFHSVKNGLDFIFKQESFLTNVLIGIHDGVRPLISQEVINRAYSTAESNGSAIPAIKSRDSIRIINAKKENKAIDRDSVLIIQTPQVFRADLLQEAYKHKFEESFTDDASVIEKSGYPIHLIEGDIRNIKITYPTDIDIAAIWVK